MAKKAATRRVAAKPILLSGWIDLHEDDLDEAQMAIRVKQTAALPGWAP